MLARRRELGFKARMRANITADTASSRAGILRGNLVIAVSVLVWSTAFPATDRLLETWDPVLLTPFRLGIASLVLLALLLATAGPGALCGVPWRQVWLVGGLGGGIASVLFIVGQSLSDGVTASIILTMGPVVAVVVAWLGGSGRPGLAAFVGVVLAVAGGVLVTLAGAELRAGFRGGELLVLAAVILWTWYSHAGISRLPGMGDLARSALLLAASAVVSGLLAIAGLSLGLVDLRADVTPSGIAWLLWLGGVAVGLTLPPWFLGVRLLGITVASMHQNLAPLYVMLLAVLLGGSVVSGQVAGAALVLAGAAIAQLRRRDRSG
ncbi:MAG: DMT family transporter [Geminicoccaceae bacterium]